MTVEAIWRYALASVLLLAAIVMAFLSLYVVPASAGTFDVEILGGKITGSSIAVLAIGVFILAAISLVSAGKQAPPAKPLTPGHGVTHHTYAQVTPLRTPLARGIHRGLWAALALVGILVLAAIWLTTRLSF
jgi:hypothetical protein